MHLVGFIIRIYHDARSSECRIKFNGFDTRGSVHRRLLSRNTNKMQLYNRIYYSKVF